MSNTEVLQMIQKDVEADLKNFEGQEFNGLNVHRLFSYQGAAIVAITKVLEEILLKENNNVKKL